MKWLLVLLVLTLSIASAASTQVQCFNTATGAQLSITSYQPRGSYSPTNALAQWNGVLDQALQQQDAKYTGNQSIGVLSLNGQMSFSSDNGGAVRAVSDDGGLQLVVKKSSSGNAIFFFNARECRIQEITN